MLTVYLTNFGVSLGQMIGEFKSFDDAVAAARKAGFEAQIMENGKLIATWTPIRGVRREKNWAR